MTKDDLIVLLDKHGIKVESKFVPWSQSRNKDAKDSRGNPTPSLNWMIRVKKGDRVLLTTDYMAGSGHCPAGKAKMPASWRNDEKRWTRDAVAFECENGRKAVYGYPFGFHKKTDPILPDVCDVMYSLLSDSDVIDFSTFESWAREFGYDADSRSAEKAYRACLEIALKLRSGLGDALMMDLREAFQDY